MICSRSRECQVLRLLSWPIQKMMVDLLNRFHVQYALKDSEQSIAYLQNSLLGGPKST